MSWWSTASIRVRLTAWYVAALSLMLVLYAAATYVSVRHEFYEQLEERERAVSQSAARDDRNETQEHLEEQLDEILVVLGLGLPVVVGLAGVGGYMLARRALAPIDRLAAEAHRISADRLHERLTVPNQHDEIGRMATVVNETLGRLESSFDQLRRFTADASHELRTPLSVMRSIGEMGLRETHTPAEYRDVVGSMLEEVDRLTRLVDTLLRLSRGEAGTIRLSPSAVDLGELAREVTTSLAVLADERRQRVDVNAAPVSVVVDRLVVREAITNVLDNAIKYAPAGSVIAVQARAEGDRAVLTISDDGPGVPEAHRERIFDRFYRVDEGRSRDAGGTGLGLAIAKWAVEAHGGAISVERRPGGGSTFRIVLPGSEQGDRRA